ncbi:hypothetical protein NIES4071_94470 [Calothrix sp. NIES-4071]|nr:hypothetical protein NIES4071_94470 [Calothrix sp. NIES-4071]BAZ63712.1 hypothetical protein NIES4105_94400 [Calothrix sp. NIES-4105]
MSPSANPEETIIEVKISQINKEKLEKAAAITGLNLSDYVMHQALSAAMQHIESYGKMVLSERDSQIFLAALENPPEANEALRKAIKEHQEEYGEW